MLSILTKSPQNNMSFEALTNLKVVGSVVVFKLLKENKSLFIQYLKYNLLWNAQINPDLPNYPVLQGEILPPWTYTYKS